ncbi:MAG: adaptor protein MecA [Lachnospiraceae bacterium]|nr:adaptor protein MecA [Lachnospiraceae bacterium]
MKFTKINDREIKCILTEDELVSFGIDLDDIIEKSERTKPFFRTIMDMAADHLGIKDEGGLHIASAQISVLKDNSISILFHSSDVADTIRKYPGVSEKINNIREKIANLIGDRRSEENIASDLKHDILNILEEQLKAEGNFSAEALSQLKELHEEIDAGRGSDNTLEGTDKESFVVRFENINECIDYCRLFGKGSNIASSLFREEKTGRYYLFALRGGSLSENFKIAKLMANEYGVLEGDSLARRTYIVDNSDLILSIDAMERLADIDG